MNDLKMAFRQLLKNPGFTAVALVTLALGIGASTAIFSVVDAVMLRPLRYPESDRLVWLAERGLDWSGGPLSYPNYVDWRAGQDVFDHFGVFNGNNFTLTGAGEPEQLPGARVSGETLAALRVPPVIGRTIIDTDDTPAAPPVVLISHGLWKRRFAGDPGVVGRPIMMDGVGHEVIGVMPAGFAFPSAVDVWVPTGGLAMDPSWQDRGNHPGLYGVARLKNGATLELARAALGTVAARLEREHPESNKNRGVVVERLLDHQVGDASRALWTLLGAVALVLLIACANVANLLMARAATRRKELAVRVALGAGRWRMIRQFLTESVLLATAGAAAGVLLAQWGLALILALAHESIPRAGEVTVDGRVLLFAAGLALLTGLVFGLAPAWHASRADAHEALADAPRGTTAGSGRLRQTLTVAEVALTLLLLVGAGLLLRSFHGLQRVDPGFSYDRVLSFRTSLPEGKYPRAAEHARFYRALVERVRALPGVDSASVASQLPLDDNAWDTTFLIEGRPEPPPHERPSMEVHLVGTEYFRTLGIPLLRGRTFTGRDDRGHLAGTGREEAWATGLNVIVIDQEFARRHFPNEDPIGRRVRLPWGPPDQAPVVTVVGIVGRVRAEKLSDAGGKVQAYFPSLQLPSRGMAVVVKTTLEPAALAGAVRQQVAALDPELPIFDVRTLADLRDGSLAAGRLNLTLLGAFAALALILAMVGLYGVLAYNVTQRRKEIGVRMALGARRGQVIALVLRQGMRLAGAGMLIGILCSIATTRLLRGFLYEVTPMDPLTFASVAATLGAVALLASFLPARRAAGVDPMVTLRHE